MHIKSLNLRSQLVTVGVRKTLLRLHYFKESNTIFVTDDGLWCIGNDATYLHSKDNQIKIELVLWHTYYLSCYYSAMPSKTQDNTLTFKNCASYI
jgi:hypothetical protein